MFNTNASYSKERPNLPIPLDDEKRPPTLRDLVVSSYIVSICIPRQTSIVNTVFSWLEEPFTEKQALTDEEEEWIKVNQSALNSIFTEMALRFGMIKLEELLEIRNTNDISDVIGTVRHNMPILTGVEVYYEKLGQGLRDYFSKIADEKERERTETNNQKTLEIIKRGLLRSYPPDYEIARKWVEGSDLTEEQKSTALNTIEYWHGVSQIVEIAGTTSGVITVNRPEDFDLAITTAERNRRLDDILGISKTDPYKITYIEIADGVNLTDEQLKSLSEFLKPEKAQTNYLDSNGEITRKPVYILEFKSKRAIVSAMHKAILSGQAVTVEDAIGNLEFKQSQVTADDKEAIIAELTNLLFENDPLRYAETISGCAQPIKAAYANRFRAVVLPGFGVESLARALAYDSHSAHGLTGEITRIVAAANIRDPKHIEALTGMGLITDDHISNQQRIREVLDRSLQRNEEDGEGGYIYNEKVAIPVGSAESSTTTAALEFNIIKGLLSEFYDDEQTTIEDMLNAAVYARLKEIIYNYHEEADVVVEHLKELINRLGLENEYDVSNMLAAKMPIK